MIDFVLDISQKFSELLTIAVSVFAIMDPPAAIPTLISYIGSLTTSEDTGIERVIVRIVNKAAAAILFLLALFSLVGEYVLKVFNVSLESLRIAGGLLLIILAVDMLLAKEKTEEVKSGDFAVVPVATPLIVGPGTMSTLIVYSRIYGPIITLIGALMAFAVTYVMLRYSYKALKYLGKSVLQGLGKFMAIIVASIAVELILSGLRGLGVI
ncbi:MAG: MarC family protein [Sulfolobales archaeon]|nr:MarC family protein [Sulfolobales archaeon]MDW8082522.1 MarC family protein [Sulfolobales archaeon]